MLPTGDIKNEGVAVFMYFDGAQCQATKKAGAVAGLSMTHNIQEPTATAIACGLNKKAETG